MKIKLTRVQDFDTLRKFAVNERAAELAEQVEEMLVQAGF
jgi:hypothetical protein